LRHNSSPGIWSPALWSVLPGNDGSSNAAEGFVLEQSQELQLVTACDLCHSGDQDLLFVKEGFRHVRCRSCGLVFVSPRLASHLEIQTESGTGSMGDDELTSAQKGRLNREVAAMEPFRLLNRMLEVGAGRGWFLSVAAQSGWQTWAVEINRDAVQHLREKGIHEVIVDTAEDFDIPERSMDVVRMWDVIEHLQSPRKAVASIHRVLRPGGLLRIATTNFASFSRWVNGPEWVYLNGADHIFLFEPHTIDRLLTECGFSQIRIRTRSFNLRRKLYHPERNLPVKYPFLRPFRKLIDAAAGVTMYGHQMIVTAIKAV
jgi:2-polyprenyl-3-methyl-5-hydroxy-6-metoxy-1,4-benzoquinol methylase